MYSILRNPTVLVQITIAETLMEKSGVHSHCMDCIKSSVGGCCQNCSNLGTNGCTNKPLACALWLCPSAERKFPKVAGELHGMMNKFPYDVSRGYRHSSLVAEARMR